MESNKLFAALTREYKNKKIERERDADLRLRELLKSHPDFAALEYVLRETEIAAAKKAVPVSEVNAAREKRDAWLTAHKITPSSLLPVRDCPVCLDSGVTEKGYCACFTKKLNALISAGHAPEQSNTFASNDLSKIKDSGQRETLRKTYAYAADICRRFPALNRNILALSGKTGTGKTYLLSALVNEIASNGFSVLYLSAFALNNLFLKVHTDFSEDQTPYLSTLTECDLLAVDDLGTEPMYKNVTLEYLYSILNERNIKGKFTFFSTNLGQKDFQARYGDRIFSRAFDTKKTAVIDFGGGDIRKQ